MHCLHGFRHHQIEHEDQRQECDDPQGDPELEIAPILSRQGLTRSRRLLRYIAHADLHPHDRQPTGAREQIERDRPDDPATVQGETRNPDQVKTRERLQNDRAIILADDGVPVRLPERPLTKIVQ